MTIILDPDIEANLRAVAERRQLTVEAYLTEMIVRDAQQWSGASEARPLAELFQDGPFLVISSPLPVGWDPVRAIEQMRVERDQQVVGL